ncbi:MAG: peroxiredoxin [Nocardioides sp.]
MSGLIVGGAAPDFSLRDQFGQDVSLSSYRGRKSVAILFYPWAFSGVCQGEMAGVRDRLAEFMTFDTEVLAISTDPVYSLRAFADAEGLNFPLLSDFWPHGEVARAYDVFDDERGVARRSSYVIDKQGLVRWSVHNALPEGRDLDEHLKQLVAAA